jgi:hypothetical protein
MSKNNNKRVFFRQILLGLLPYWTIVAGPSPPPPPFGKYRSLLVEKKLFGVFLPNGLIYLSRTEGLVYRKLY